jgi:hypothetical protein
LRPEQKKFPTGFRKTDDFKIAVLDGSEKDFGKLVKAR